MGYRLTDMWCATLSKWRTQGGAGGALSTSFAPLRHLRHPLLQETGGGGALNPRAQPRTHGGDTAGWRLRLADHDARLLTTRKAQTP
jgi:hypothetical protein